MGTECTEEKAGATAADADESSSPGFAAGRGIWSSAPCSGPCITTACSLRPAPSDTHPRPSLSCAVSPPASRQPCHELPRLLYPPHGSCCLPARRLTQKRTRFAPRMSSPCAQIQSDVAGLLPRPPEIFQIVNCQTHDRPGSHRLRAFNGHAGRPRTK